MSLSLPSEGSFLEKVIENVNKKAGDSFEKFTGDGYIDGEFETIEQVKPLEIFGWDTGLYEDISPGSGPNGEIMLWDCDRYPESPLCGGGWNPERMIDLLGKFRVFETRCYKCISWTYYLAGFALPPSTVCERKPECKPPEYEEDKKEEREGDRQGISEDGDPDDYLYVLYFLKNRTINFYSGKTGNYWNPITQSYIFSPDLCNASDFYSEDKIKNQEVWFNPFKNTLAWRWSEINRYARNDGERTEENRFRRSLGSRGYEIENLYAGVDWDGTPFSFPYSRLIKPGELYQDSFGTYINFTNTLGYRILDKEDPNGQHILNWADSTDSNSPDGNYSGDIVIYAGKRKHLRAYFPNGFSKSQSINESYTDPSTFECQVAITHNRLYTYEVQVFKVNPKELLEDSPPGNMDKDCCNSDGIQALTRLVRKIHKYVGATDDELENALLSKRLNTIGEVEGHETPKNIPQVLEFLIRQIDRAVGFLPVQIEIAKTTGVDAEGNAQEEELSVEFHTISDALKQLFELNRDMAKAQITAQANVAQPEQDKIENEVTITRLCLASLYELATIHKLVVIAQNDVNLLKEYFNPDYRDRPITVPFAFDLSAGQLGFGEGLDQLPPDPNKQTLEYFKRLLQPGRQRIVLSQLNPKEITLDERLQEIAKNCATAAAALSQRVGSESQAKALIEAAQFALKMGRFLNQDDTEQVLKRMGQGAADLSEFESSVERGYPEERTEATPYGLPEQEAPRVYRRTRRRSSARGN